jgi:hypothetical protein
MLKCFLRVKAKTGSAGWTTDASTTDGVAGSTRTRPDWLDSYPARLARLALLAGRTSVAVLLHDSTRHPSPVLLQGQRQTEGDKHKDGDARTVQGR